MPATEKKIGIIILAAGSSSRLGEPKQLLLFRDKTLIRNAVETAIETEAENVVVVLGANFERIKTEIEDLACAIVFNENWKNGMSSSIATGLEKLLEIAPETFAAIISLCDQPLIESRHLDRLIHSFRHTQKPVVSAFYNNKAGVPALFSKDFFSKLLELEGDRGARFLLNGGAENLEKIEMREAAFDIDTPEDFEHLTRIRER